MRAAVAASLLDAAGREVVAVDDAFASASTAGLPMARTAPAGARKVTSPAADAAPTDRRESGGGTGAPESDATGAPAPAPAPAPDAATVSTTRPGYGDQARGGGTPAAFDAAGRELDGPAA
jgi:hypothetical protein